MQFWNSNPFTMIQLIEFESFVPAAFGPLLAVQVRFMGELIKSSYKLFRTESCTKQEGLSNSKKVFLIFLNILAVKSVIKYSSSHKVVVIQKKSEMCLL